jgi:hypothetical protein
MAPTTRRPTGWVVRQPPFSHWQPMRKRPTKNEIVYDSDVAAQKRADELNVQDELRNK